MERIQIGSIYELYELYAELYSRNLGWKASEAEAITYAMTCLATYGKRQLMLKKPGIDFEAEGFTVMEVFSGKGEHFKHIQLPSKLKINSYNHLDIVDHSATAPNFVCGDALKADFTNIGANLILALFYTVSSISDAEGNHSREVLLEFFKNMHRNLKPGGGFFIDYAPDGYNQGLYLEADEDEQEQSYDVGPNRPLRDRFEIPYHVKCEIELSQKVVYDRMTATVLETFVGPISINAGSRTVAQVTVSQPFTQRYFTEPELVDIAKEAGFQDIMFFNNDYSDGDFERLEAKLETEVDIDEDNVGDYQSNAMLMIA